MAEHIDLSTIIAQQTSIIQFIEQYFVSNEDMPPLNSSDALFRYRINRIVRDKSVSFDFYGIPGVGIDAYIINKVDYAIYFRAKIKDMLGFKKITDDLGYPVNITTEDYHAGDFDFLHWKQKGFEIFATHLRVEEANILFKIGNLSIKDLYKVDLGSFKGDW